MKKKWAVLVIAIFLMAIPSGVALAWNGGVSDSADCDTYTVSADPHDQNAGGGFVWKPVNVTGTGTFNWGILQVTADYSVTIKWQKFWGIIPWNDFHEETFTGTAHRPGNCQVTICHVAGLASDPANLITLTLSINGALGHFTENGTPLAGHEQDYFGACIPPEVSGCTDPTASNYDPQATVDDGSCYWSGCTDPTASNYDPQATVDDGSCIPWCVWNPTIPADDPTCVMPEPVLVLSDPNCAGWSANVTNLPLGATTQGTGSGLWTNPYVLENANGTIIVNMPDGTTRTFPWSIDEPENCLVVLGDPVFSSGVDCEGWWVDVEAAEGSVIVGVESGVWNEPYFLESANGKLTVDLPDGRHFDFPWNLDEPEICLVIPGKPSVNIDVNCDRWIVVPVMEDGVTYATFGAPLSGEWGSETQVWGGINFTLQNEEMVTVYWEAFLPDYCGGDQPTPETPGEEPETGLTEGPSAIWLIVPLGVVGLAMMTIFALKRK